MGTVVFKEGDQSNSKFYIILSGEAGVVMHEKKPKSKKRLNKKPKTCWLNSIDLCNPLTPQNPDTNHSMEYLEKEFLGSPVNKVQSHGFFNMGGSMPIFQGKTMDPRKDLSISLEVIEDKTLKTLDWEITQEDQYDPEKFEEYVLKYGKVIRYIKEGDSFGELALKSDEQRSATIMCKTDCEFLVMTKQQFDLIFAKKEKEKEELLATLFPFFYKTVLYADKNFFLYSFKVNFDM